MRKPLIHAVAATLLMTSLPAATIVKRNGERIERISLTSVTYEEVSYRIPRISIPQRISGAEVREIIFTESGDLQRARELVQRGDWGAALELFGKSRLNPAEEEAAAFGAAWCYYRKFDDTGERWAEAAQRLTDYLEKFRRRKGFYIPQALYLLGDIHYQNGKASAAARLFDELAGLPGASRQCMALIGQARLELDRGKPSDALSTLATVRTRARRAELPALEQEALLLRGRALIAAGRPRETIELIERELLDEGERERSRLLAQAHNLIGDAYAALGGSKNKWKAMYRYLWTTVHFSRWRKEAAEGFYKAAKVARALDVTPDADRLRALLKSRYADTAWARRP